MIQQPQTGKHGKKRCPVDVTVHAVCVFELKLELKFGDAGIVPTVVAGRLSMDIANQLVWWKYLRVSRRRDLDARLTLRCPC
jgi:hypothetical protein